MKSKSRTPYLILGLLAEGPCSGYDIRRITLARFRFFWSESFGQIYPCLKGLEREGLIAAAGESGRGKVVWRITAAGKRAFAEWLKVEAQPETVRYEAILKFYFSWAMPEEDRARLLSSFRDRQEASLRELEAFREELLRIPDPQGNHDVALATIDLGIATYGAWRDWAVARLGVVGA
ncbi:MAG: PadR family transcriptional regulator [Spirochaetaceae bacterium]|nr:PadR family transcriptional regulator [Spirochaetaceae bacterium]